MLNHFYIISSVKHLDQFLSKISFFLVLNVNITFNFGIKASNQLFKIILIKKGLIFTSFLVDFFFKFRSSLHQCFSIFFSLFLKMSREEKSWNITSICTTFFVDRRYFLLDTGTMDSSFSDWQLNVCFFFFFEEGTQWNPF